MAIDIPELDDREFEEIFERARRQIPIYSEEWTDHNAHDTGIAILELLAWISETYTYQIDQVTDRDRVKHLQLLDVSREPPQPATGQIAVEVPDGCDGATIGSGIRLAVDDHSDTVKTFETSQETILTEASIERVVTVAGDDSLNKTRENRAQNPHFYPFGDDPEAGDALYLGFDRDPFENAEFLEIDCALHEEDLPDPASHGDYERTFEPSVEVQWQYCLDYDRWDEPTAWASVPVEEDGTNAFYRSGRVVLREPPNWDVHDERASPVECLGQPPGSVWLRCRIVTPGYEITPAIQSIRMNVLEVSHRRTVEHEFLRKADETLETTLDPNQEFFFDETPILDATIAVDGEEWTEVDDFDSSDPTDKHYLLDRNRGAVVFGDGIDGSKPPVGTHVIATRYVCGGGVEGNVSERAEWRFADPDTLIADGLSLDDLQIRPIGPTTGGTEAESIEESFERFKRDQTVPYRTVTLDDYEYVATHTPGLRFGRAAASSETRVTPDGHDRRVVVVVVVPYSEQAQPRPSRGFLDAVREHLNRCRLITDTVEVRRPEYVPLEVDVRVSPMPGRSDHEVSRAVRAELSDFLHPISGDGGDGWPIGQTVYGEDLRETIAGLDVVNAVEQISLGAGGDADVDEYGNVIIDDMAFPSLSERDVRVSIQSDDIRGGTR